MVIIATFNSSNYSLVREQKFPSWESSKQSMGLVTDIW